VVDEHSVVVEASSGSTSIAFAMACARVGVPFNAVIPADVSDERVLIIRRYGAEVVLTSAADEMAGAIAAAEQLGAGDPHVILPRQFSNP
jgi:cysteine synthase A